MGEFDYRELFITIITKWLVIVSTVVIVTGITAVYSIFFVQPLYESNISLYIGRNIESEAAVVYNDLLLGESLANDYRELIKSRSITSTVIQNLGLQTSPQSLAGRLNIESKKDTRLIVISVLDKDPQIAMDIAREVAIVFSDKIVEIMEVKNLQIIDVPELPVGPVGPNVKKNISIAFMLSIMLGIGIVLILEYLDHTIITLTDVKKDVGLMIIGTIPVCDKLKHKKELIQSIRNCYFYIARLIPKK